MTKAIVRRSLCPDVLTNKRDIDIYDKGREDEMNEEFPFFLILLIGISIIMFLFGYGMREFI